MRRDHRRYVAVFARPLAVAALFGWRDSLSAFHIHHSAFLDRADYATAGQRRSPRVSYTTPAAMSAPSAPQYQAK